MAILVGPAGSGSSLNGLTSDATGLYPTTTDTRSLGTSTKMWSDLFLASGGVINWDNGDVTLTHASNTLTLSGGVLALPAGTAAAPSLAVRNANAGLFSTVDNWVMISTAGTARWLVSAGEVRMESTAALGWSSGDPTAANADTGLARVAAGSARVSDGSTGYGLLRVSGLGIGAAAVADKLMMPSAGVIDFNAGDVTITHAANSLTFAGASSDIIFSSPVRISASQYIYAVGELDLGSNNATSKLVVTAAATANVKIQQTSIFGWVNSTNANTGTLTLGLTQNGAGVLEINTGTAAAGPISARMCNTNAAYEQFTPITEAHTLAAAGTSTTATAVFPAGSAGLAASFRITTEITGCTSVQVGVSGDTTRFGTFSTLTAGQTIAVGRIDNYTAQTGVLFTAVGGGASFTAGVVRVDLRYVNASAPTS